MAREDMDVKGKKVWRVKEDRKPTGEEENPWIDVPVKSIKQNSSEKATTFYVTNLPEWTTGRDLWIECQPCGVICDAVIPKRRDHAGKVFGFVRFKRIKDQAKLLQALNNVWIGNKKIKVNVSKFKKEWRMEDKGRYHERQGYRYEGQDYSGNKRGGVRNIQKKEQNVKQNSYIPNSVNGEQVSYRDILTGHKKTNEKEKESS
ncbi:putative RNA recognition motif domain, nucleotide-binding alpha-beta plait domain superfamily [Helianthus annuus]|nr:putative RNA recognition motif domain, nucleotide-binding alpha-beta plait domain superfamily [Helianthus annuus]